MKVLVINSGSSSIKYELFDMRDHTVLASGLLERIGEAESRLRHRGRDEQGRMSETVQSGPVPDHREGLRRIVAVLSASGVLKDTRDLFGIGHRVVHGGEAFHEPTLIDAEVIATIRRQIPLAPLHNPANIMGIEVALAHCPEVPQVAVFDTAFHQSIPPHAFHYALPYDLYAAHGIRRYGFHGTSHHYVAQQAAAYLGRPLRSTNLIVLHLGNGASATAIEAGRSVDTSMGMTPLEGLMMGTRCGDLDPAVVFYLGRVTGQSNEQIESLLNTESGLKGICGTNDMREVLRLAAASEEEAGAGGRRPAEGGGGEVEGGREKAEGGGEEVELSSEQSAPSIQHSAFSIQHSPPAEPTRGPRPSTPALARLGLSMYAYRVRKYIGAYCAVLSRVDAVVFTAGIGENSPEVRARSCQGLANLGILIDPQKNAASPGGIFEIQAETSAVKVLVVPTDEELQIAKETVRRIQEEGGTLASAF
jgi:acetate kinase